MPGEPPHKIAQAYYRGGCQRGFLSSHELSPPNGISDENLKNAKCNFMRICYYRYRVLAGLEKNYYLKPDFRV